VSPLPKLGIHLNHELHHSHKVLMSILLFGSHQWTKEKGKDGM
jgi:hypothetical protein